MKPETKKTLINVGIFAVIVIFVAGLTFLGGMNSRPHKEIPLDTLLLKSYGYVRMDKILWVKPIPGEVRKSLIVVPVVVKKTKESFWLLSITNDMKVGVNLDKLKTEEDLERWHELFEEEK